MGEVMTCNSSSAVAAACVAELSGAGVAAGFAALAIGTETDGSIISPANANGVVGIKPTVGVVSQAGIIPISASQDSAGPMTRTVEDAAVLLGVISTRGAGYRRGLKKDALRGKRLGVLRDPFTGYSEHTDRCYEKALAALQDCGAVLVSVVDLPASPRGAPSFCARRF